MSFNVSDDVVGWTIININNDYGILYMIIFLLYSFMPGGKLPEPPSISYKLQNKGTGAVRKVTLPGRHKPEDLIAAVGRLQ